MALLAGGSALAQGWGEPDGSCRPVSPPVVLGRDFARQLRSSVGSPPAATRQAPLGASPLG